MSSYDKRKRVCYWTYLLFCLLFQKYLGLLILEDNVDYFFFLLSIAKGMTIFY